MKKVCSISGWRADPATEPTSGCRCDIAEILKKCGNNLHLPKEIDRISVNGMKPVNGSAAIERKLGIGAFGIFDASRFGYLYTRADKELGESMFGESEGRKSADESFSKGMIGEEYDFVGVFNDGSSDESAHDYEVFIVAVNPSSEGCIF